MTRRTHAVGASALVTLAALATPSSAHAAPQFGSAFTVGGGSVTLEPDGRHVAAFHLGARADVLFGRDRDRGMAGGPYVVGGIDAFRVTTWGGGASWLVPLREGLPVVLSGGLVARDAPAAGWSPALTANVFVGSRSYNFESPYGLTGGLFLEARHSLAGLPSTDVIAGVAIDLSLLLYPALAIRSAVR